MARLLGPDGPICGRHSTSTTPSFRRAATRATSTWAVRRFAPAPPTCPAPGDLRLALFGPTRVGRLLLVEPAGRRGAGRVLRGRPDLRRDAAAGARRTGGGDARRGAADRPGGLQPQGAGGRKGRDGRAGERVQQDERPAQRPRWTSFAASRSRSTVRSAGSGEAFASGLDRQALLQVVVETSLGACGAEYGTIVLQRPHRGPRRRRGLAAPAIEDLVGGGRGRRARMTTGSSRASGWRLFALAATLRRLGDQPGNVGVMTVAREGEEFSARRARRLPVPGRPGLGPRSRTSRCTSW